MCYSRSERKIRDTRFPVQVHCPEANPHGDNSLIRDQVSQHRSRHGLVIDVCFDLCVLGANNCFRRQWFLECVHLSNKRFSLSSMETTRATMGTSRFSFTRLYRHNLAAHAFPIYTEAYPFFHSRSFFRG